MLLRILLYGLIAYSVLAATVFFIQRRLLYFPKIGELEEGLRLSAGLRYWPEPGDAYRGFISNTPASDKNGTVIVFHGNAGSASSRSYYIDALEPMGYRVVIAEYPGYGNRKGNLGERVFVEDAKKTVRLVEHKFDGPIFLWGESLGCGVATAVASDTSMPVTGLVLLTPWDSLTDLALRIYWYLPVRWLLLDPFDNVSNVSRFSGRIAVVLAQQDEIIPFRHGYRLFDSINGEKKLWKFPGAGHNSWPVEPNQLWWKEVMGFVSGDPDSAPRLP